jgi:hypothetical protein
MYRKPGREQEPGVQEQPPSDEELALLASARRRRLLVVGAPLVLILLGVLLFASPWLRDLGGKWDKWRDARSARPLPPEASAEIQANLTKAKARLEKDRDAFRRVLRAETVGDELRAHGEAGACPYSFPMPRDEAGWAAWSDTGRYTRIERAQVEQADSSMLRSVASSIADIETSAAAPIPERLMAKTSESLRRRALETTLGYQGVEFLFVVDEVVAPTGGVKDFVSGHVRGRAFVYSFQRRRMLCGAQLDVRSSANVVSTRSLWSAPGSGLDRALESDLERNVHVALATKLAPM